MKLMMMMMMMMMMMILMIMIIMATIIYINILSMDNPPLIDDLFLPILT